MAIRVMLAEDHAIVREGIRVLIERESDMEVVCEAENGLEAVQKACKLRPDVVVMDVTMPEINGVEATRQIKAAASDIKILALSVHDKREYVMDMIRAGVSGYLLKDCVSAELVGAIRRVAANESYLSPKIAAIVIEEHNVNQPHYIKLLPVQERLSIARRQKTNIARATQLRCRPIAPAKGRAKTENA